MLKASWMGLLIVSMSLSAAGFADEAKFTDTDAEPLPELTYSLEALYPELGYTSRWYLFHPAEATAYPDDWPGPIADFDFRNSSALARVSRLRSLSLLTLVEIGQTRLFFGVNDDGLVGLHFNARPRSGDESYLEVVRMPYLRKN